MVSARAARCSLAKVVDRRKLGSFPTWFESGRRGCFQRSMSLNGSRRVDHGSHGFDMNETRLCTLRQFKAFFGGDGASRRPARRGRRGALRRHQSDSTGTEGLASAHPPLACRFAYPSPHSPYTHPKPGRRPKYPLPGVTRTTKSPTGPYATVPVAKPH
jgi:hypothetical protein